MMDRKKVIGIVLAVAIIAAAGVGSFFLLSAPSRDQIPLGVIVYRAQFEWRIAFTDVSAETQQSRVAFKLSFANLTYVDWTALPDLWNPGNLSYFHFENGTPCRNNTPPRPPCQFSTVAVGDMIVVDMFSWGAGMDFQLKDMVLDTVLAAGILPPLHRVTVDVSKSVDGLNWVIEFTTVSESIAIFYMELGVWNSSTSRTLFPRTPLTNLSGDATFVPINASAVYLNVGDKILLNVSAFPEGSGFSLSAQWGSKRLWQGTLE